MEDLKQSRISAYILTFVALITLIGPYAADWNNTHIYNPNWPPHAKFHNAQTMLLGTLLALSTLWYTWKPASNIKFREINLKVALLFAALYWISQGFSILFPGTSFIDPEFGEVPQWMGIQGQLLFIIPILILLLIAYYLRNKSSLQTESGKLG